MNSRKVTCSLCTKTISYFATFSHYDYYTPSSKIYYCKNCDLFQKKVDIVSRENVKIDYYQNYTNKELLSRSISRKISLKTYEYRKVKLNDGNTFYRILVGKFETQIETLEFCKNNYNTYYWGGPWEAEAHPPWEGGTQ